jgi:hypothetical protein
MSDSYIDWRDRLASANDPKFWPIEAIDAMLIAGTAQFWCTGLAALVTKIVEYPGGAVALEAVAASGDLDSLRSHITEYVEKWAREQGLTHLLIAGRDGWTRVHKDWRHYQTVLLKELG